MRACGSHSAIALKVHDYSTTILLFFLKLIMGLSIFLRKNGIKARGIGAFRINQRHSQQPNSIHQRPTQHNCQLHRRLHQLQPRRTRVLQQQGPQALGIHRIHQSRSSRNTGGHRRHFHCAMADPVKVSVTAGFNVCKICPFSVLQDLHNRFAGPFHPSRGSIACIILRPCAYHQLQT